MASTQRVQQPGQETGHLLVYLVCIYLYTVLVRTDFEKFNFHPKYVNNFCICNVIEVLNGQNSDVCWVSFGCDSSEYFFKDKICPYCHESVWFRFGFGKTEMYVIYLFVHICLCHWLSAFWMASNFIFISLLYLLLLEILDRFPLFLRSLLRASSSQQQRNVWEDRSILPLTDLIIRAVIGPTGNTLCNFFNIISLKTPKLLSPWQVFNFRLNKSCT